MDQPPNRDFHMYNGSQIAVIVDVQGDPRILRGTALCQQDPDYGRVLRISLGACQRGDPELIIAESQWAGSIEADSMYGCDYAIHLKQAVPPLT